MGNKNNDQNKSKISFNFNITNIGGIHPNLNFNENLSSLKIAIYANNGSGKTCISRAFRLLEAKNEQKDKDMLSFGESKGSISVMIKDKQGEIKENTKVEIPLNDSNKLPSNYIFHVFNSEYVKENLEVSDYKPNGEIDGYILGKNKIDLSKEEAELKNKEGEFNTKKELFETFVNSEKEKLCKDFSIKKNMKEYENFDAKTLLKKDNLGYEKKESFEFLKEQNKKLKDFPEDMKDITDINFQVNIDFLKDLKEILNKEITKSSFAEEFKEKIKSKQDFIKLGVEIYNKEKDSCPFCEQSLSVSALNLIDKYTEFLNEEEAKIIAKLKEYKNELDELRTTFENYNKQSLAIKIAFDDLKTYFIDFKEESIAIIANVDDDLKQNIESIRQKIQNKIDNISNKIDINEEIEFLEGFIDKNMKICSKNEGKISKINKAKEKMKDEKTNLRKEICKAKYLEILETKEKDISEIEGIEKEIGVLNDNIKEKRRNEKISKKDKVVETFETLLKRFFDEKYIFDKDKFCLKFNSHILDKKASKVLSDGEKCIVAFCLYLAEAHTKIEQEEDYKKLFFIIDDPISSMDFHYVYNVAQVIRGLDELFNIERLKYIILTHNLEFMSILIRNKIVSEYFVLENLEINKLDKQLIMPYENHLRDIYNIARNEVKPTHTTANSIRHILEVINKFERPDLNFNDFFEQLEELQNNEFLYSLIHDNSHGNMRNELTHTDDMIRKGCKAVVNFIKNKFKGQITLLEKSCGEKNND